MDYSFIHNLFKAFEFPLPGREIQYKMAPGHRTAYHQLPDEYKTACVLALLFPKNNEWHLAFIERISHENDKHAGQISFPGGRMEKTDLNHVYCAKRETEEEIGVPSRDINIIGKLSDLYVFVSNYNVHPFLGYIDHQPVFNPQESEVKSVLEVPVSHFTAIEHQRTRDIKVRNIMLRDVPYYDLFGHVLWGATAMMMSELTSIMKSTMDGRGSFS